MWIDIPAPSARVDNALRWRGNIKTTARLNGVDPRAWLADVLGRIADYPASRLHDLLPWNWRKTAADTASAVAA
jgi:hypothetical protein